MDSERQKVRLLGAAACGLMLLWAAKSYRSWGIRTAPVPFLFRLVRGNDISLAIHGDPRVAIRAMAKELKRSPKATDVKVRLLDRKCFLIYDRQATSMDGELWVWPNSSEITGGIACEVSINPVSDEMIRVVAQHGGDSDDFEYYGAAVRYDSFPTG